MNGKTLTRFFDGPLPIGRNPRILPIADQEPGVRIMGHYLADATELRYRDRSADRRIDLLYRQMMQITGKLIQARGIERLEF